MISSKQQNWLRLIVDHNPFYLLSAICMVVGCHTLNSALYDKGGNIPKLLTVLAVINAYEAAVIGLGAVLLRRNGVVQRDARILLALEALFLADAGFLSGVISTVDPRWGWGVNGALLALAAVKVTVVCRALRLPRISGMLAVVLVQLFVLLAVPTVFKQVAMARRGFLPDLAGYAAWWVAGLLPVLAMILMRLRGVGELRQEWFVKAALVIVPFLSALVHVYGAAWVYDLKFLAADLTPVLLGLAVTMSALGAWGVPRAVVRRSQLIFVAVAVLCSLQYPGSLVFGFGGLVVTPFRITILTVAIASAYALWMYSELAFAVAAVACLAVAVLGPNIGEAWDALWRIFAGIGALLSRLVPSTALQWGITAVAAAFVLLGLGATVSFWKKPGEGDPQEPMAAATGSIPNEDA